MNNNQRFPALREAINNVGGIVKFAAAAGVTHQAVYAWFSKGWMPLERAVVVERLSGVDRMRLVKPSLAQALEAAAVNDVL